MAARLRPSLAAGLRYGSALPDPPSAAAAARGSRTAAPADGDAAGRGALRADLPEAVLRGGPGRGGPTGRSARSAARHCVRPTRLCVRRRGRHGPGAAGRAAERGRE